MKWLKRLLVLMGLLASTALLLVMVLSLFVLALQDPVEMKSKNTQAGAQGVIKIMEHAEDRRVSKQ